MRDLEAIYLRLPVPLQHMACSFVGWRTTRTRYGGEFPQILAEAKARRTGRQRRLSPIAIAGSPNSYRRLRPQFPHTASDSRSRDSGRRRSAPSPTCRRFPS